MNGRCGLLRMTGRKSRGRPQGRRGWASFCVQSVVGGRGDPRRARLGPEVRATLPRPGVGQEVGTDSPEARGGTGEVRGSASGMRTVY